MAEGLEGASEGAKELKPDLKNRMRQLKQFVTAEKNPDKAQEMAESVNEERDAIASEIEAAEEIHQEIIAREKTLATTDSLSAAHLNAGIDASVVGTNIERLREKLKKTKWHIQQTTGCLKP